MAPRSVEKSCIVYIDIWSTKNELNPEEVAISSHKKYWFDCKVCGHDYEQSVNNKTNSNSECPICSGRSLCGSLDCALCLPKSCYIYRNIWSSNNQLHPAEVAISSNTNFWFKCNVCVHDYKQSPSNKTNGKGCPYCSGQKICGYFTCIFCLPKSCYIYNDIWSSRNKLLPEEISISNDKKFWFYCEVCSHDYIQRPSNKTNKNQGCPLCKNKTEKIVADFLKEFLIAFISQFKLNSNKRYDFCLTEFKLIIEVDGPQHFRQISNWGCPEINLQNDNKKTKIALENGYSVLRIYQPDIWNEAIDWRQTILDNMYNRTKPDITYVSSNPEIYNSHKEI
jgi:very-short-patch-repair endonuclease